MRGETGFVSGFERKVLFRIARFVAFTVCLVLFLWMVIGLVSIGMTFVRTNAPDPAQVVRSLKPDAGNGSPQTEGGSSSSSAPSVLGVQSPLIGIRWPPELQERMNDENTRRVLENWLSEFEQEDRQPFMDGLGATVREARASGVDEVNAINTYYTQYKSYLAERETNRLVTTQARLIAAGVVMSILLLLALFSLVLVLLAIERNTYRAASQASER